MPGSSKEPEELEEPLARDGGTAKGLMAQTVQINRKRCLDLRNKRPIISTEPKYTCLSNK